MAWRKDVDGYKREIDAERAALAPPKDGAVFYTNSHLGARDAANAHVADSAARGEAATTIEDTDYGKRLDGDNLWRRSQDRDRAHEVWKHASRRYAENARGRTEAFCAGREPGPDSVFAQVERDALLDNEKVTHLNGVRREDLKAIRDRGDPNAERDMNRMIVEGDRLRDDPKREAKLEALRADIDKEAAREARRAKLEEERRRALAAADRRAAAQEASVPSAAPPEARRADAPETGKRAPVAAAQAQPEAAARPAPQAARDEAASAGRRRWNEKLERGAGRGRDKDARGRNAPGGG